MRRFCLLIALILLVSCGHRTGLAPVEELKWHPENMNQKTHRVLRGETLYAISFRYDQDYRQIAVINHLAYPYSLRVGQVLRLKNQARSTLYHPSTRRALPSKRFSRSVNSYHAPLRQSYSSSLPWMWPVKGRIASRFIPQQGKKGIDIAGKKGESIRAAASGVVAYAGAGLTGYGNLIIIKHNDQFLTAYGNNLSNKVREGQVVKAGQIIADMGIIDRRFWGLHFEIRRAGQPVNPLLYLPAAR